MIYDIFLDYAKHFTVQVHKVKIDAKYNEHKTKTINK